MSKKYERRGHFIYVNGGCLMQLCPAYDDKPVGDDRAAYIDALIAEANSAADWKAYALGMKAAIEYFAEWNAHVGFPGWQQEHEHPCRVFRDAAAKCPESVIVQDKVTVTLSKKALAKFDELCAILRELIAKEKQDE